MVNVNLTEEECRHVRTVLLKEANSLRMDSSGRETAARDEMTAKADKLSYLAAKF